MSLWMTMLLDDRRSVTAINLENAKSVQFVLDRGMDLLHAVVEMPDKNYELHDLKTVGKIFTAVNGIPFDKRNYEA